MNKPDLSLEYPPCPLCGEEESQPLFKARDTWVPDGHSGNRRFAVVRCVRCRTAYTSPRFPEELKHLAFAGSYPFYERSRRSQVPPSAAEMNAFDSRIRQIHRLHPVPGSVLDVGMGDGAFLAAMKKRGWDVTGVDVESSVIVYAQSCLGIQNCRQADAEMDPLPAGPFDVITLWGFFQLAYHPQSLLARLREISAPGGLLVIGLSNIDSAGAKIFGSRWHGLGLPRHLIHYSPETLKKLLDRSGYRMLDAEFETPGWIVNGSVNAVITLPWPIDKAFRFAARTTLGFLGHSRWGDTFSIAAQATGG